MQENAIINGDCLELLPGIEDESIDLVFADPPFNVGKPYDDDNLNCEGSCDLSPSHAVEFQGVLF